MLRVKQEEQGTGEWGDAAGRTDGPSALGETLGSDSRVWTPPPPLVGRTNCYKVCAVSLGSRSPDETADCGVPAGGKERVVGGAPLSAALQRVRKA